MKKIKPNKSDPEFDLTTDNLKNAPHSLYVHLSNFFQGILIQGAVNTSLLVCAIILLVKNKKGATDDSSNYRGIALSSILLKVFDWIVLILFEKEPVWLPEGELGQHLHLDSHRDCELFC